MCGLSIGLERHIRMQALNDEEGNKAHEEIKRKLFDEETGAKGIFWRDSGLLMGVVGDATSDVCCPIVQMANSARNSSRPKKRSLRSQRLSSKAT